MYPAKRSCSENAGCFSRGDGRSSIKISAWLMDILSSRNTRVMFEPANAASDRQIQLTQHQVHHAAICLCPACRDMIEISVSAPNERCFAAIYFMQITSLLMQQEMLRANDNPDACNQCAPSHQHSQKLTTLTAARGGAQQQDIHEGGQQSVK